MVKATIDEIQKDPIKYLRQVEAWETITSLKADVPIAELIAY